eukprot:TRINITY_DN5236_c0_g1_i2.p3 TRINITY_DN5236_c0_g1~~TRINITY_DN5236_c0_g1_i2.p3  ORF type:complete len:153 (-),score=34.63 TRINITY_DN5236_c0_g1_i2:136-594(-)
MLSGAPPFYSQDKEKMFKQILTQPIQMRPYFSENVSSLLSQLLIVKPEKRLGAKSIDEIKGHEFFKKIDWQMVAEKKIDPPFKPAINAENDVGNFDKMFTDEPPTEENQSDSDGEEIEHYENFSLINGLSQIRDSQLEQANNNSNNLSLIHI